MLDSKTRAYLRTLANKLEVTVMIGKGGITTSVITSVLEAIGPRELIKIKILEAAGMTARDISDVICPEIDACPVSCVGSKLVIYKHNPKLENGIVLPKKRK